MNAIQPTPAKPTGSPRETAEIDALSQFQLRPTQDLAAQVAQEALRLEGFSTGDVVASAPAPESEANTDLSQLSFGPQAARIVRR